MDKYQSYKPSGIEWIGEIPEHWDLLKIKNLYNFIKGSGITKSDIDENGLNECILYGELYTRFKEFNVIPNDFSRTNFEDKIISEGNELLIPGSTTTTSVDLCNCKTLNYSGIQLGGDIIVLKPRKSEINNQFYSYFISNVSKPDFEIGGRGVTIYHIYPKQIREIHIPRLPLQEQNQIVQFLDEKTELIDKLISTKERKITLLKEQRTSLINQVVTKGLNPNVKMKDSGVEWIGEIPEGWVVSKFKFVSEIVTGNTPSKTDGGDYYSEEGFLWIKPTYLKGDKYVNDSDEKLTELGKKQTRVIPKDSIMICCIGNTIGKYGMSGQEVSTNQQINSVIPNKSKIIPWYCLYFVDVFTRDLLNRSNFVTLPILTKSDLENIEIIIPTLEEQVCIVEIINSKTKEIDDLVQLEQKKIDLLKEYRKSLISEVVTGKIKVTTDE